MFRNARGHLFNSAPERDLAQKLYGLDSSRCFVVGTGLNDFEADPDAFAQQHGIGAPYVLYSGRREPMKGTPLLLDYMNAFRQRTGRDVKLVLTGSGPVDVPVELEGHVYDAGLLSETDKQNAMAGAVTFCHPSVNESLSIVILESWLARTPVLVNGGADVMPNQCSRSGGGLWFRNYPEFEEELLLLLDHEELCTAMAEAGRKYVLEEYSWNSIGEKLFRAVNQI
jgi:glycosyltransferase involved in cell wall biosynthesis